MFSGHSLCVWAAVLLVEARKDRDCINLQLHWLSEAYCIYLHYTKTLTCQSNEVLSLNSLALVSLCLDPSHLPSYTTAVGRVAVAKDAAMGTYVDLD